MNFIRVSYQKFSKYHELSISTYCFFDGHQQAKDFIYGTGDYSRDIIEYPSYYQESGTMNFWIKNLNHFDAFDKNPLFEQYFYPHRVNTPKKAMDIILSYFPYIGREEAIQTTVRN
jgi:hypothetical protein